MTKPWKMRTYASDERLLLPLHCRTTNIHSHALFYVVLTVLCGCFCSVWVNTVQRRRWRKMQPAVDSHTRRASLSAYKHSPQKLPPILGYNSQVRRKTDIRRVWMSFRFAKDSVGGTKEDDVVGDWLVCARDPER